MTHPEADMSASSITTSEESSPATLIDDAAPLTDSQRQMAIFYRDAISRKSLVPPLYFVAAGVGKLLLGFGASLAVKGHYSHERTSFITGVVLAAIGFVGVVFAALGFGKSAAQVSKKLGILLKCASISGGSLIGIGYALNQYFVSTHAPLATIRASFVPLMFGTSLMSISLPNFFAYAELRLGRTTFIPYQHRHITSYLCFLAAIGLLFAGWISGEHSEWNTAFNAIVLTLATTLAFVSFSIYRSDHLRLVAAQYERKMIDEDTRWKASTPDVEKTPQIV